VTAVLNSSQEGLKHFKLILWKVKRKEK
jgi:hypothetical protein